MSNPAVSVCCITYNHEKYIRDALEGFLMQQTNFSFEILIHDDASTDGTADIIREYEAKYPGIIKPIYQTENQYSKGIDISATFNFPRVQGKYIALCEGDDFWTDPHKLQIQYDFMESHPDYSLCGCRSWHLNEIKKYFLAPRTKREWHEMYPGMESVAFLWDRPFETATFFFRCDALKRVVNLIVRDTEKMPFGDVQLMYHLAQQGKTKCLPQRMAVYRMHRNSAMNFSGESRGFTNLNMFAAHIRLAVYNHQEAYIPQIIQHAIAIFYSRAGLMDNWKRLLTMLYLKFSLGAKNYKIYRQCGNHGLTDKLMEKKETASSNAD